jgi:hypothetical protein
MKSDQSFFHPYAMPVKKLGYTALILSFLGGCASTDNGGLFGGSQTTRQTATGAAIGAAAGNVLGYMTGHDRSTTTVLGALIGGGIGYWQGKQADQRLQQAQATSQEVAQVGSQSSYQYDQPKLYAREGVENGQQVATFDKLETPIPYEAVKSHSSDASTVLRKLGALAARNNSDVKIYAPTQAARSYMISEIKEGAAGAPLAIDSSQSNETKVVLGRI